MAFAWPRPEQALEPFIARAHDAGCKVTFMAGGVPEAVRAAEAGADVIIAQGTEGGGHVGWQASLALVPMVVDAVAPVPVLAAGGIADGRGLAAALALGAAGAQVGTAFLACPESAVHPLHRAALLSAHADDTTITRAFSGRPARALRNRATDEGGGAPLAFPAQLSLTAALGIAAAEHGSPDFLALWAGQAAPLAVELPAAELIARIAGEAERALAALNS
jgi:NAD(P)H-dependent flavin oxidoreductase YrpB (nitropropane dioxygenase family)